MIFNSYKLFLSAAGTLFFAASFVYFLSLINSLLVASWSRLVSTIDFFKCTYLTVEPLMNMFLTLDRCGYFSLLLDEMLSNFKFKNWSTDFRVPVSSIPFFSSTLTSWSTRVLKNENNSMVLDSTALVQRSMHLTFECVVVVLSNFNMKLF